MEKKITLAAVILSICGLVSEYMEYDSNQFLKFGMRIFNFESYHADFGTANITNVIGYVIFLTGALLYYFSRFRESRLLRFSFSLVFLSKVVSLFFMLVYVLASGVLASIFVTAGHLVIQLLIFAAAFFALRHMNRSRELLSEVNDYGEMQTVVYLPATNWQRVFHLVVDFAICYLVFFPVVEGLIMTDAIGSSLRALEQALGEKGALYIVIIFFRSIFYILFEAVFQITPAKFLTESRVTDDQGNKPEFPNIIGRTFSRFVPFEPLSFLAHSGWHDNWSGTEVLQEKRTGIKGSYYFLVFPAAILIFFCYVFIADAYQKNKMEQRERAAFEQNVADTDYKLAHISANDIIELRDNSYESKYLKAENVSADAVEFSVIKKFDNAASYGSIIDETEMEQVYNAGKGEFNTVTLSRARLAQAVWRKRDVQFEGFKLFDDEPRLYKIETIQSYFMPRLEINHSYGHTGDYIRFPVKNSGWPAYIVAIKGIDGDIDWPSVENAPLRLNGGKYSYQTQEITGRGKDIGDFKVQLTVKDTLGRMQVYEVTGTKDEMPVMRKIQ